MHSFNGGGLSLRLAKRVSPVLGVPGRAGKAETHPDITSSWDFQASRPCGCSRSIFPSPRYSRSWWGRPPPRPSLSQPRRGFVSGVPARCSGSTKEQNAGFVVQEDAGQASAGQTPRRDEARARLPVGGHLRAFNHGKSHGCSSHWLAQPKSLSLMVFRATQPRLLACRRLRLESFEILRHWMICSG